MKKKLFIGILSFLFFTHSVSPIYSKVMASLFAYTTFFYLLSLDNKKQYPFYTAELVAQSVKHLLS